MGERIVQREAGCEGKITQTGKVMSKPIERKSVVGPTGNLQQSSLSFSTAEVHTSQVCHMCRGINAWDASVKVADGNRRVLYYAPKR